MQYHYFNAPLGAKKTLFYGRTGLSWSRVGSGRVGSGRSAMFFIWSKVCGSLLRSLANGPNTYVGPVVQDCSSSSPRAHSNVHYPLLFTPIISANALYRSNPEVLNNAGQHNWWHHRKCIEINATKFLVLFWSSIYEKHLLDQKQWHKEQSADLTYRS